MRGFIHRVIGLTVIVILSCLPVTAQVGFRKGYIVKNNGDTLTGMLFYGTDARFSKACRFKRFDIVRDAIYRPDQLQAFGFRNGRHFESKSAGKRKTFYERLLKGPVSLYCLPGKPNGPLFIDHASTGFTTLGRDLKILTLITGISTDTVEYRASSVIALIRASAGRSQRSVVASHMTPGVNLLADYSFTAANSVWQFGMTGGYQFLKVDIPGNSLTRFFNEARYNSSFRPVMGVFVNRKLSKKSDNASLDLSLLYFSDRYYGYAEYRTGTDCRDYISLEFKGFQFPLTLKYVLGNHRFRPYFKAGFYGSILIDRTFERFSERQFGPEIFTDRYSDYKINNDRGFLGGAGAEIPLGHARRACIEIFYLRGYQLLPYSGKFYTEPVDSKVNSRIFSVMLNINL